MSALYIAFVQLCTGLFPWFYQRRLCVPTPGDPLVDKVEAKPVISNRKRWAGGNKTNKK
jgi:hypothetical protein